MSTTTDQRDELAKALKEGVRLLGTVRTFQLRDEDMPQFAVEQIDKFIKDWEGKQ